MKTKLPQSITTVEEAQAFLTDLYNNREHFHPEDDALDMFWGEIPNEKEWPTNDEANLLNKLMDDIYALPGNDGRHCDPMVFCPCGFLLELDPEYVKMRDEDEAEYERMQNESH